MAFLTDRFGVPLSDIFINSALGKLQGIEPIAVRGHATTLSPNLITLWDDQSLYVWPTSSQISSMAVASTNAGDNAATGQGAHSVIVEGLDIDYNPITEVATLSGITPVNLTNDFFRINKYYVGVAGSSSTNLGALWVGEGAFSDGEPANKFSLIESHTGNALCGFYTVPASHSLILLDYAISTIISEDVKLELWVSIEEGIFRREYVQYLGETLMSGIQAPICFLTKSDIEIRAKDGAGRPKSTSTYLGMLLVCDTVFNSEGVL